MRVTNDSPTRATAQIGRVFAFAATAVMIVLTLFWIGVLHGRGAVIGHQAPGEVEAPLARGF